MTPGFQPACRFCGKPDDLRRTPYGVVCNDGVGCSKRFDAISVRNKTLEEVAALVEGNPGLEMAKLSEQIRGLKTYPTALIWPKEK